MSTYAMAGGPCAPTPMPGFAAEWRLAVEERRNALWHVYANGVWQSVWCDGYAPVNADVNGRTHPVEYRHRAHGCATEACGWDIPSA